MTAPLPPGRTRPWFACTGKPCTCPKVGSKRAAVDLEAITPDTAAEAVRRLLDRCDELDQREPAWRYLTVAQIRAELAAVTS